MRRNPTLFALLAFLFAAALCLAGAAVAVSVVEDKTEINIRETLDRNGHDWAEVEADGLRVILTGTAPDEASRFLALSSAGENVDAARIIDEMDVVPGTQVEPPRFSAEILRNVDGISIIGLIPTRTDRNRLNRRLAEIAGAGTVADFLESADYAVPSGWDAAMDFALSVLDRMPRSKISVSADTLVVSGMTDSAEAKAELEDNLSRTAPPHLKLTLDISSPRPVITPFTLRFLIDDRGPRFDACSADTELTRGRIIKAAAAVGVTGDADCTIGLGVPSPNWGTAAELTIAALAELGGGQLTMADAEISLTAAQGTDPDRFDLVVGELQTALPPVFALDAVLPEPEDTGKGDGPPEFTATLSPEGLVQLRGRVEDETQRLMADSFARAQFGSDRVHMAVRVVPGQPDDWAVRVLVGLEALAELLNGSATVTPDSVSLRGASYDPDADAKLSRLLAAKLGDVGGFALEIETRDRPIPQDAPPDPELCEAQIIEVQQKQKIAFEPGSATITEDSLGTMNRIADILSDCGEIRLEIQGHTDSQGREVMNKELSQSRAQSVLNELRARRVLTSSYAAVGYGESRPIADNGTEAGREANRRIEFHLIRPEPIKEEQTTLEAVAAESAPETAADAASETGEDAGEDSGETATDGDAEAAAGDSADGDGTENANNEQN